MGTSSALPDDLDAWATASRGLDEVLRSRKATLDRLHSEFTTVLGWGRFDASSLLEGLGGWMTWNERDAQWVGTIAQAFRDAGSGTIPDAAIEARLRAAGLNTPRLSITYDDPIALGEPPTSGYANDPVNTATGNFVEVEIDLAANGLVRLTRFARTYNSRSDRAGPFGPGWASWASARLRPEPDGAHWEAPDGQRAVIPRAAHPGGGAGYARVVGVPGRVVAAGDGFAVEWFGGGRLVFDRQGRPLAADDGPGTEVRFQHDGDRLVGIAHAGGATVTLGWDGDRVADLRSSDGRRVAYRYDDRGRLVEVDGPSGVRRYAEIDAAGWTGHLDRP